MGVSLQEFKEQLKIIIGETTNRQSDPHKSPQAKKSSGLVPSSYKSK